MRKLTVRVFLVVPLLLAAACQAHQEETASDISAVMSSATTVAFDLPAPKSQALRFSSPNELDRLRSWLLAGKPAGLASYVDPTVPVTVELSEGGNFNFRMSDPRSPIEYSTVSWNGKKYVLPPFPLREGLGSLGGKLETH